MYHGVTSAQESGLSMTLTGLKLEKYLQLFNKKCIKFDTFVNMTKEDLNAIGITDEADQDAILEGVEPLKHLYRDVNDLGQPNMEAILGNTIHHLKTLLGMMILIRRKLTKKKPKNTLLDTTHSAAGTVMRLLDVLDADLEYVKNDFLGTKVYSKKGSLKSKKKFWCIFGVFTAATTLASMVIIKQIGLNEFVNRINVLQHIKIKN